jgi:predicted nucleic acid-binding protein
VIVVSNTSPLISLAHIGQLHLLKQLYNRIIVPGAVYEEAVVAGAERPGANEVRSEDWIQIQQVSNHQEISVLTSFLGQGEAEAIVLAQEIGADLLLIDENLGRKEAANRGLTYLGVLGMLIDAKRVGLLPEIEPVLNDLIFNAGFHIDKSLYSHVLQLAGE